ncbi:MAG: hypothetical protein R3324_11575, partial [Halobacteriales archaeon]|nr:hypothetical protein [Halobacteriales archaeon]
IGLSEDGSTVVYALKDDPFTMVELYSASADASGSPVLLETFLASDTERLETDWGQLRLDTTGTRVLYLTEDDTQAEPVHRLYSLLTDGSGAPVELNAPLPVGASGVNSSFWFGPDGQWVHYEADQTVAGEVELWTVPADRSTPPTRAHPQLTSDETLGRDWFVGDRIVVEVRNTLAEYDRLYSAPLDGSSSPIRLDDGGATSQISSVLPTPNGDRLLYTNDVTTDNEYEFYSVPVDGSAAPLRLSAPGSGVFGPWLSDDGTIAVYRADPDDGFTAHFKLFSIPVEGGARTILTPPLDTSVTCPGTAFTGVCGVRVGGSSVLYEATPQSGPGGIHTVPVTGGSPTLLSTERFADVALRGKRFPGSSTPPTILLWPYDSRQELYRVSYDGSLPPALLTADHTPESCTCIESPIPLGDGSRVVYLQRTPDNQDKLFIADDGRHEIVAPDTTPRVQEGDTVLIPVRLSQATVESVQVDVAVTGGTAGGADLDFFTSSL